MFAYDVVELFPDIISVFREQLRHSKGTWRAAAVQHLMAEELSDIGVRRDAEHAADDVVHIYQKMVFGIADVAAIGVIVQQPEGSIFKKVSRTVIHYKNVLHRAILNPQRRGSNIFQVCDLYTTCCNYKDSPRG